MNYIDIFAGAGGLSEGFVQVGFKGIAHIEKDVFASQTLKTRNAFYFLKNENRLEEYYKYTSGVITKESLFQGIPKEVLDNVINVEVDEKNISEIFDRINKLMLINNEEEVDVLIGGPPCQAYSLVGRAKDANGMLDDPRNYLYKLYVRFLKEYQPKYFVFENVPGLLSANGGKTVKNIKAFMKRVGYEIEARELNAFDYGVLQSRRRIIIIGWRKELNGQFPHIHFRRFHDPIVNDLFRDLSPLNSGEEINSYIDEPNEYLLWSNIRNYEDVLTHHIARKHNERDLEIYQLAITKWNNEKSRIKYNDLPEYLKTHKNISSFLDRFKVVAGDLESSHTMLAHISKDGHHFIHPDIQQQRSLSVREAARIQSFPDNYYFEGPRTAKFVQIGNAVPPLMAKAIAEGLTSMI